MSFNWNKIKKTVKRELSDAAVATKKYSRIGKVKYDKMNINNSLNDTFQELGIEVFEQITEEVKGDIRQNPKVKSLIDKVHQLKESIKEEELKIEVLRNDSVSKSKNDVKPAHPPAVKAGKAV